jgi:predicted small metal-binding protein
MSGLEPAVNPPRCLRCPCGVLIEAQDDDELVSRAREHLAVAHPGREYTRDEILFLAM